MAYILNILAEFLKGMQFDDRLSNKNFKSLTN